jgi:hypothetical protein
MSAYYSVLFSLNRLSAVVAASGIITKYSPDQPRVPAGNPDGGQWTSIGAESENDFPISFQLAARRGRSAKYCMAQYASDMFFCSFVEPAPSRAACRAQAAQRLASCLRGHPIPPLNY